MSRWIAPRASIATDLVGMSGHKIHTRHAPETLAVLCWCQMNTVHVPRQTILDCRTESCGEVWCHE